MAASFVSGHWMEWVERLSQSKPVKVRLRPDPDRFSCFVDEQPSLLVPRRFLLAREAESERTEHSPNQPDLEWNPRCTICGPGEIPAELTHVNEWCEGFALSSHSTAWIQARGSGQWRPFWLGDDLAERVRAAQQFGIRAVSFDATERESLRCAGVLASPFREERGNADWEAAAATSRARFQQNGYCAVDGLLHPFHVGELRRYCRRTIRRGRIALGDHQSNRRYVAHNEPVTRFFHLQLTEAVSQLVGEPVKPSYVYFASYQGGAKLERHTDREQCEFSITFCLDYAPEPAGATPWPLHLDAHRSRVTVQQALGGALLYRGRELPHYRDRLPDGHTSTSIFFHYVRADFTGSLS